MKENKKEAILQAFSANVKVLRKMHNQTQAYLAQKLHVSKSSVSNWEKGIRLPETETILQLAQIYGVSCEHLLGSSKRPQPYVPEDKFIDKDRYLDLSELSPDGQNAVKSFYKFMCASEK